MISKATNIEKTVGYIRASSDQQMAASPARQKADCREIAKRFQLLPIEDGGWYEEAKGRSGLRRDNRDALGRLLVDAQDGKFSHLVVSESSRLGREKLSHQMALYEQILDTGVRLFAGSREIELDNLASWILESVAAHEQRKESQTIAERSTSGKRSKLALQDENRKPEYIGPVLPGLMKVYLFQGEVLHIARYSDPPKKYTKSKGAVCELRPTDDLNEIDGIRAMFDAMADGKNSREAADVLNSYGIRTRKTKKFPDGNLWAPPEARNLARLRQYIGDYVVGEHRRGQFHKVTDGSEIIHGVCEPIIDRAVWEAAQGTLDALRRNPGRRSRDPQYLLSGLIFSPNGHPLYGSKAGSGKRTYTEYTGRIYEIGQRRLSILCELIDNAVLSELRGFLSDPAIIADMEAKLVEDLRTVEAVADPTAAELKSVRDKIERAMGKLFEVDNPRIAEYVEKEVAKLEKRERELKERQDRTRERGQRTAEVKKILGFLPTLLESPDPELGTALAACIDRVVLRRVGNGWEAVIEFPDGGGSIVLDDRKINGHLVCHQVADWIDERGETCNAEVSEMFGIKPSSVWHVINRANGRGRNIQRIRPGVYVSSGNNEPAEPSGWFSASEVLRSLALRELQIVA